MRLMFSLPNLESTVGVLSSMITPAVMILATSSLILTTTNRLVRIVDRVREMLPEFEEHRQLSVIRLLGARELLVRSGA